MKEVFITSNDKVKCNLPDKDISRMSHCTHGEADTHMFVHVRHAVLCGLTCSGFKYSAMDWLWRG